MVRASPPSQHLRNQVLQVNFIGAIDFQKKTAYNNKGKNFSLYNIPEEWNKDDKTQHKVFLCIKEDPDYGAAFPSLSQLGLCGQTRGGMALATD